jgi:hypothetical protein
MAVQPEDRRPVRDDPPRQGGGNRLVVALLVVITILAGAALVAVLMEPDPPPPPTDTAGATPTASIDTAGQPVVTEQSVDTVGTVATTAPGPVATDADRLRGQVVAIVWSDFGALGPDTERKRATYESRLGLSLEAIDGGWYRSLRQGTVAIAYAGGFPDLRAAASWCVDRGLAGPKGVSCFGVELSDRWTPSDDEGRGRIYPAQL